MSNAELNQLFLNEKYIISRKENRSYLHNACRTGNENIIKYLMKHGVDINKEDIYGETPIFSACSNGSVKVVKYLVKHGADIHIKNKNGVTVLFSACVRGGNENVVKLLVEHGADF
ncbi:hypothetical protein PIROE2DRAFT_48513, partial [Piromyces sp. E2]